MIAEGTEFKVPVFKLKKKDEDKFLTAGGIDNPLDINPDGNYANRKWYVLLKRWILQSYFWWKTLDSLHITYNFANVLGHGTDSLLNQKNLLEMQSMLTRRQVMLPLKS